MLAPMDLENVREAGYAICTGVDESMSTLDFAKRIGTVLNLHSLDQAYPDRVIDRLRPQDRSAGSLNRYHGNYGFEDYPAHTDLAQWLIPPRYLLLRGRIGAGLVKTYVYNAQSVEAMLPTSLVKRAIFFPRNARVTTAIPLRIPRTEEFTLRWDPLFIRPANSYANACVEILRSAAFVAERQALTLTGDSATLIIDNWRSLHGRSAVPIQDRTRVVERIYLEKIYGIPS